MRFAPSPVLAVFWALAAGSASALELNLPETAQLTAERVSPLGSFAAPVGVYGAEGVPTIDIEGEVNRRAWRIPTEGLTPLQVITPLRDQLEAAGFKIAFECAASDCGGFDFRFATEVLPGPNMYVNLAQYRYLTAFSGPADQVTEAVGIMVSVAEASAFLQIIHAGSDASGRVAPKVEQTAFAISEAKEPASPEPLGLGERLAGEGVVVLSDLEFETGSSRLSAGNYNSLNDLAAVLSAQANWRVALVGHTDTVGGLDGNIALSRARAESVRARLVEEYGIDARRLDAEGMGYLAPIASNLTPEGRDRNRRVEAVLLNTE